MAGALRTVLRSGTNESPASQKACTAAEAHLSPVGSMPAIRCGWLRSKFLCYADLATS